VRNNLRKRPNNTLLDDFFEDEFFMPQSKFGYHIDVYQESNNFVVEVELPGFKRDEINVSFNNDLLTIKAEHKEEVNKDDKKHVYRSRSYSSYMKQIRFSNIDHNSIDASFTDGVLKVKMPSKGEASVNEKQIEVK